MLLLSTIHEPPTLTPSPQQVLTVLFQVGAQGHWLTGGRAATGVQTSIHFQELHQMRTCGTNVTWAQLWARSLEISAHNEPLAQAQP